MTDLEQQLFHQRLTIATDFGALPLGARVLDRLTAIIVLTDEILGEFQIEEANALLWLEPHVRRVYDEVDLLMRRLAQ